LKVFEIKMFENLVLSVPYTLLRAYSAKNEKSPSSSVHKGIGLVENQIQIRNSDIKRSNNAYL
jgi:hypothetical protein